MPDESKPSAGAKANAPSADELDERLTPIEDFQERAESWMKEITSQVARLASASEQENQRREALDTRLNDIEQRIQSLLTLTEMISMNENPFAGGQGSGAGPSPQPAPTEPIAPEAPAAPAPAETPPPDAPAADPAPAPTATEPAKAKPTEVAAPPPAAPAPNVPEPGAPQHPPSAPPPEASAPTSLYEEPAPPAPSPSPPTTTTAPAGYPPEAARQIAEALAEAPYPGRESAPSAHDPFHNPPPPQAAPPRPLGPLVPDPEANGWSTDAPSHPAPTAEAVAVPTDSKDASQRAADRVLVLEWAHMLAQRLPRAEIPDFLQRYVEAGWVTAPLAGRVRSLAVGLAHHDPDAPDDDTLHDIHLRTTVLLSYLDGAPIPAAEAMEVLRRAQALTVGHWSADEADASAGTASVMIGEPASSEPASDAPADEEAD